MNNNNKIVSLPALAVKRLTKELREPALPGLSLLPLDGNLACWHGNIVIMSGPYDGIVFHVMVEVPAEYPSKAPALFFKTAIRYQNGAQTEVPGKGTSICLDLLGNFANVHTEWGSAASGWSPANTLQTIMIQLQGVLNDMLSSSPAEISRARDSARSYVCSCGHKGLSAESYSPAVGLASASAASPKKQKADSVAVSDPSDEVGVLRRKAEAYDSLLGALQSALSSGADTGPLVVAAVAAYSKEQAGGNKEREPLSLAHLVCYVSGSSPQQDADEIFGFGVCLGGNGSLSTPAELISKTAWDSGIRRGSQNQEIGFFMPIYISDKHWALSQSVWGKSVEAIYAAWDSKKRNRDPASLKLPIAVKALQLFCSLMNSACVSTSEGASVAHDNFIEGYIAMLRIVRLLCAEKAVCDFADAAVERFVKTSAERAKDKVGNLGDFLVLLQASSRFKWKDVAPVFLEEVDARNVRWMLDKHPQLGSLEAVQNRLGLTFQAAETSVRLVSFQVRFLELSRNLDMTSFADGAAPRELIAALKDIHGTVKAQKNWGDYIRTLGMQIPSMQDREAALVAAVRLSSQRGYHGGGGGGGGNRNRNKGGGRRY